MAQAKRTKKSDVQYSLEIPSLLRRLNESAFFLLVVVALYLLICLVSYDSLDPSWSYSGNGKQEVTNIGGLMGAWFADISLYLFGYLAYAFPVLLGYMGWLIFRAWKQVETQKTPPLVLLRWSGLILAMVSGSALATMHYSGVVYSTHLGAGGAFGNLIASKFVAFFSYTGSTLILLALFLCGFTLFSRLSWFRLMDWLGEGVLVVCTYSWSWFQWNGQDSHRVRAETISDANADFTESKASGQIVPELFGALENQTNQKVENSALPKNSAPLLDLSSLEKEPKKLKQVEASIPETSAFSKPPNICKSLADGQVDKVAALGKDNSSEALSITTSDIFQAAEKKVKAEPKLWTRNSQNKSPLSLVDRLKQVLPKRRSPAIRKEPVIENLVGLDIEEAKDRLDINRFDVVPITKHVAKK